MCCFISSNFCKYIRVCENVIKSCSNEGRFFNNYNLFLDWIFNIKWNIIVVRECICCVIILERVIVKVEWLCILIVEVYCYIEWFMVFNK